MNRGDSKWVTRFASKFILSVVMARTGRALTNTAVLVVLVAAVLSLGGVRSAFVVSDSMVPAFEKGDLLLVSQDFGEVSVGDVVLYSATWNERLVSHRVVSVKEDFILLQGDSNEFPDPPAPKSSVFGVVAGVLPNLGWVVNPYGVWTLLGLGIGLELVSYKFEYVGRHRE